MDKDTSQDHPAGLEAGEDLSARAVPQNSPAVAGMADGGRHLCLGVGDGSGRLFVYGDYDSIKAAQALVFRAETAASLRRAAIEADRLASEFGELDSPADADELLGNICATLRTALAATQAKPCTEDGSGVDVCQKDNRPCYVGGEHGPAQGLGEALARTSTLLAGWIGVTRPARRRIPSDRPDLFAQWVAGQSVSIRPDDLQALIRAAENADWLQRALAALEPAKPATSEESGTGRLDTTKTPEPQ